MKLICNCWGNFARRILGKFWTALTQKEKNLNPKAMITYKRPTTIGQQVTNYKELALNKTRKQTKVGSRPCEHCALCGCYGKNNKSMVLL